VNSSLIDQGNNKEGDDNKNQKNADCYSDGMILFMHNWLMVLVSAHRILPRLLIFRIPFNPTTCTDY